MYRCRSAAAAVGALILCGCGGGGGGSSAPEQPVVAPPTQPPRAFVDVTQSAGINYQIGYRIQPPQGEVEQLATGGVAAGDYDSDGDVDLFITRGDIGPNLLYRNNGFGVFFDVADAAGVAFTATSDESYRNSGPIFADMDGDGDLDLFLGGLWGDPSLIYSNDGDGTFTDVTFGSGIDGMLAEQSISAAFGDYDLDGDLDMFVSHFGTPVDRNDPGDTEHLWRNDTSGGTILFTNVTVSAGISPSIINLPDMRAERYEIDTTFAASFARIGDDLYPDIVVAADNDRSMVFTNNGDGTFDNATDVSVITDSFGMGMTLGDYDDDGDLDWFVTSIMNDPQPDFDRPDFDGNRFYRNDNGVFANATVPTGVIDGGWGWGACFTDFENDGDLDIYHTNGFPLYDVYVTDVSRAFVSDGSGSFSDQAEDLGLDDTEEGRGVVCADFDGDGDSDILQLHRDSTVSATLWRNNQGSNGNYLSVKLHGTPPNTEAAGARIFATTGTRTMMREIIIGNNFVSQSPTVQHFGLGTFSQVDELRIEWPDGQETLTTNVSAGQTLEFDQP